MFCCRLPITSISQNMRFQWISHKFTPDIMYHIEFPVHVPSLKTAINLTFSKKVSTIIRTVNFVDRSLAPNVFFFIPENVSTTTCGFRLRSGGSGPALGMGSHSFTPVTTLGLGKVQVSGNSCRGKAKLDHISLYTIYHLSIILPGKSSPRSLFQLNHCSIRWLEKL